MSTTAQIPLPEPWLRGTLAEVPAVARAVLHAIELAREDIERWCRDLTEAEMHATPYDLPSVAFHIRHICRSLDRLLTYAEGEQLTVPQIAALKVEHDPGATPEAIFQEFQISCEDAAARVRVLGAGDLEQTRGVGRKALPTSVGGLLVHCADHTQCHTGQAVTTAKLLLALRKPHQIGQQGFAPAE